MVKNWVFRFMKRIILTATSDLSHDRRMQRLAGSLYELGYEVLLVGRQLPGSKPFSSQGFCSKRLRCFFHRGKLFYLEYQIRLTILLFFEKYDLGWAADLDTALPHYLMKRLRSQPWVYDAHEYFTEVPELQGRSFSKRIWEMVARHCIPRSDVAVTVGEALAEVLSKRYQKNFGVLRNLPEVTAPAPLPKRLPRKERPVLIYQGALNLGRGLPELLEAMCVLEEAALWLVGEGDLSQALRQKCDQLKLTARVKFWGFVAPEELPALTRRATIGLDLLNASSLNYYYSLSNKSLDYLHAGLPSLEMDFPEYRHLHEQWGVYELLPDINPATIIRAVRNLLDNPEKYERLSANALQAAKRLNWQRESQKLMNMLRNLH